MKSDGLDKHVILLVQDGYFRSCLTALLRTIPQIKRIDQVSQPSDLTARHSQPDLVILDEALVDEAYRTFQSVWPAVQRLILADRLWHNAPSKLADLPVMLSKSAPTGEFLAAVEKLLRDQPPNLREKPLPAVQVVYC